MTEKDSGNNQCAEEDGSEDSAGAPDVSGEADSGGASVLSGAEDVASPDVVGTSMTEATFSCLDSNARPSEVSMKIIAAPTVTLLRNVPGPRLPNTV